MAETVLADAQFSIAHVLRPYTDFETTYQGQPASDRIMVSEVIEGPGGEPRDQLALLRTPGIDPNLVRGLATPMGSRVLIWLPKIVPDNTLAIGATPIRYIWTLEWRMRNVFDNRQTRSGWHFPKQGQGVPDTTSGAPEARTVLPSANQTVVYTQPEPLGVTGTVAQNARVESYTVGGQFPGAAPPFGNPLMPGGATGAIQQGILDPAVFPGSAYGATSSYFQLIETQAAGDELMIGLTRDVPDTGVFPDWDFTQNPGSFDRDVSIFLGVGTTVGTPTGPFPDLGVYVLTGCSP